MTITELDRAAEDSFHQLRREAELALKLASIQVDRAENRAEVSTGIVSEVAP